MKKYLKILTTFALVLGLLVLPTQVNAANEVAQIGDTKYATLAEAIAQAQDGAVIELLTDSEAIADIWLTKSLTFNLNRHAINGSESANSLFVLKDKTVKATFNNGIIEMKNHTPGSFGIRSQGGEMVFNNIELRVAEPNGDNNYNYGIYSQAYNTEKNGDQYNYAKVTFNNSKVIEVNDPAIDDSTNFGVVGIAIYGASDKDQDGNYVKTSFLEFNNGTINTRGFAISGHGTSHGTSINITSGTMTSQNSTGIYHPQAGTMNITGGTISGKTGIAIRAGELNISGENTTIIGTGKPTSTTPNGNGTTTDGAAIAVTQHTTKLPISVNISGGKLEGYTALYESNPQKNSQEDLDKINIQVNGGTFKATNGGTLAVFSEDFTDFVKGGTFAGQVDEEYIVKDNSLETVKNPDGTTTIAPKATSISLPASLKLEVGTSDQLKATVGPEGAITSIKWSSSDEKVATVDENGKVTAVSAGKATITAETSNGLKTTCEVTVKEKTIKVTFKGVVDGEIVEPENAEDGTFEVEKGTYFTEGELKELEGLKDLFDIEGYTFKGFFMDKEGTEVLKANVPMNEDTTIYMIWNKNTDITVTPDDSNKPITPTETTKPVETPEKGEKVETGDNSAIALYGSICALAVVGAGIVVLKKKREELLNK